MTKLEKEVIDFILWLTPCGEVTENPTPQTIGKEARRLNRKIKNNGWKISLYCDGLGCVDKNCKSAICQAINGRR